MSDQHGCDALSRGFCEAIVVLEYRKVLNVAVCLLSQGAGPRANLVSNKSVDDSLTGAAGEGVKDSRIIMQAPD